MPQESKPNNENKAQPVRENQPQRSRIEEQKGYQPTGKPADLSKITPPQRPSPIAPTPAPAPAQTPTQQATTEQK